MVPLTIELAYLLHVQRLNHTSTMPVTKYQSNPCFHISLHRTLGAIYRSRSGMYWQGFHLCSHTGQENTAYHSRRLHASDTLPKKLDTRRIKDSMVILNIEQDFDSKGWCRRIACRSPETSCIILIIRKYNFPTVLELYRKI